VEDRDITMAGELAGQDLPFVSTYTHALDSKKRLTIPSDWREIAGVPRRLLVLPGVDVKCLCVYPAREMTRRLEKLRELSIADERGRQFARTLASRSDLVAWDSQGRIRIKDELLDYAGLINQVELTGALDHFELWSPENLKLTNPMEPKALADAIRSVGF